MCMYTHAAITVAYRGLIHRNISYRTSICMHIDFRYEMLRINPLYATVMAQYIDMHMYVYVHMYVYQHI